MIRDFEPVISRIISAACRFPRSLKGKWPVSMTSIRLLSDPLFLCIVSFFGTPTGIYENIPLQGSRSSPMVKTKSAPVPMHFTLRKNATLLGSPRDERHVGISNTNPMYIPEERVMFLYQRIGHTFYTLFYVLIIMIPALLIPLMILLPLFVDLN